MANLGTCKLCQTANVEICASHVIPEFFYKKIYTSSHKFTAVAKDSCEQLTVEQKGYRERLLCLSCETKLSKWEGKLSQLTNEITSDSYVTCTATKVLNVLVVNEIDYLNVKLAILSIFWRLSVATHRLFSGYDLGPYAEEFRQILDQRRMLSDTDFPVILSKGILEGSFQSGILLPVGRGRYDKSLIMQSVVLNGIVFDCFMTSTKSIPEEVLAFSLQPSGRALLSSRPYEELGMNVGDFSERMKKQDVKSFFARHA